MIRWKGLDLGMRIVCMENYKFGIDFFYFPLTEGKPAQSNRSSCESKVFNKRSSFHNDELELQINQLVILNSPFSESVP